eukprot:snap_masked-scaffold_17-processed-gene-6.22-mRNA-1 protein AED:1.00 eAED:1.00 QI:0/0/0/0/1/1/2/0/66
MTLAITLISLNRDQRAHRISIASVLSILKLKKIENSIYSDKDIISFNDSLINFIEQIMTGKNLSIK